LDVNGCYCSISFDGCYEVWDKLGRWIRFDALLFLLIVFLVLSLIRFRKSPVSANNG